MTGQQLSNGPRNLLLIDAGTFVGDLVLKVMTERGWRVTTAGSHEAARQAIASSRFDRLLINCYPSRIEALELLDDRQTTVNADTPAGVLAGPSPAEMDEARKRGAAWVREFSSIASPRELVRLVETAG